MAPPWSSALTEYARTPHPASLPSDVLVAYDEHTLTIQDAFPKAQYHYLVLPRMPWRLTGEEWGEVQKDMAEGKKGEAGGGSKEPEQVAQKQGKQQQQLNFAGGSMGLARPAPKETTAQASSSSSHQEGATTSTKSDPQHIIPPTHLVNLTTLLSSPYRSIILRHLSRAANAAEQRIRSLMPRTRIEGQESGQQTAGCAWDVQVGFHAVPSMDTVHCHVLSGELVSERLKNKKHYLSFHPTAGFFLPLSSFLPPSTPTPPSKLAHPASHYEALLKGPLVSHVDRRTYPNIPALKRHLSEAWVRGLVQGRKKEVGGGEGGSGNRTTASAAPTVAEQDEHSETEDEEEDGNDKRPEKRLKVDNGGIKKGGGGSKAEMVSDGSHTESETEDEAV